MCGPGAPWTPPPRGLSHATPLGGCCVTVHDPSPAHAGGSCHPCQGVSPTGGRTIPSVRKRMIHCSIMVSCCAITDDIARVA